MKRAIYIMIVVVSIVFVSCREKQIYTQREILTMQKYAEELATYMIKDTTGIHIPFSYSGTTLNRIIDTITFADGNGKNKIYYRGCGIWIAGYNTDKYGDLIISEVSITCGVSNSLEVLLGNYNNVLSESDDSCKTKINMSFAIDLKHGKPYIEYHSGWKYICADYQSFSDRNSIFHDYSPDSLTITGIGDNSDFKMVFKKNIGLVYVSDTAHHTWTLVE